MLPIYRVDMVSVYLLVQMLCGFLKQFDYCYLICCKTRYNVRVIKRVFFDRMLFCQEMDDFHITKICQHCMDWTETLGITHCSFSRGQIASTPNNVRVGERENSKSDSNNYVPVFVRTHTINCSIYRG